ncbi:hypothetical protein ACM66B_000753 [Microbotryomycetes sp. NB124-2]
MSRNRDLDAPEEIDSYGRAQDTIGGRRQRVSGASTRERGLPYSRPSSAPSAAAADKWSHDLFTPLSSLYTPSINVHAVKGRQRTSAPSPSLRPFGNHTPDNDGSAYQLDPRASRHDPARAPSGNAQAPQAVSVQGQSQKQRELERQQKLQQDKARKAERIRQVEQRKKLEKQHAEQTRIAEQEDKGSVVQVEGLVVGTSADDVQTAFGNYGETSFCYIANENSGGDLIARLTFKRYEDANQACIKLNGAIADGKPLTVKMVNRTPFPNPLPPFSMEAATPVATSIPVPARKMYADEIETVDPRFSGPVFVQDDEDVSMDVESEALPASRNERRGSAKRGANRRPALESNGRLSSAPAAVSAPSTAPSQPVSLLSRFGMADSRPTSAPAKASAPTGTGRPAAQSGSGSMSLLDRLGGGQSSSNNPPRGGNPKTKSGSLSARIK